MWIRGLVSLALRNILRLARLAEVGIDFIRDVKCVFSRAQKNKNELRGQARRSFLPPLFVLNDLDTPHLNSYSLSI